MHPLGLPASIAGLPESGALDPHPVVSTRSLFVMRVLIAPKAANKLQNLSS
jgi:hypothetical protein